MPGIGKACINWKERKRITKKVKYQNSVPRQVSLPQHELPAAQVEIRDRQISRLTTPINFDGEIEVALPVQNDVLTDFVSTFQTVNDDVKSVSIEDQLCRWTVENNVKGSAVNSLLSILRSHNCFTSLPKDCRTLLKTPRKINIKQIEPGSYCHFPLSNTLECIFRANSYVQQIKLQINVDGLPISSSSSQQFWPILAKVIDPPIKIPFVIGLYCGSDKPKSSNSFLKYAVEDILKCKTLNINNQIKQVQLIIHSVVCDSPARAFILNVKGHTGYFGCQKCECEGEYFQNRVIFPSKVAKLRTDASFRLELNEEHHLGEKSELLKLPIDIVGQVPLDYQHLVCLGAVRKLINLWIRGKITRFRLQARDVHQLSRNLITLKQFFPSDFSRKPRSLNQLKNWKATEFRTFLLYSGPVALRNILPENYYNHFLSLHVAISILCSKRLQPLYFNYAKQLLEYFVQNFASLYGRENLSYNIHNLLHLANDSEKFGVLDNFSTFCFENHLGKIKRLIRSGNRPLEQVHNRIWEQQNHLFPEECETQASIWKEFSLTNTFGNNCCILECGSVFAVSDIFESGNEFIIEGKKLLHESDWYSSPCKSTLLGIKRFKDLSNSIQIDSSRVIGKAILYKVDGVFVSFPLLHTLN